MNQQASPMVLLFIATTIIFTVAGQLSVKWGMQQLGASPEDLAQLPMFIWRVLTNIGFLFGMTCAVLAALTWSLALSHSKLSFAYPFMAAAIVLVLVLSSLIFDEHVPVTRWLGVVVVGIGIFLAAQ